MTKQAFKFTAEETRFVFVATTLNNATLKRVHNYAASVLGHDEQSISRLTSYYRNLILDTTTIASIEDINSGCANAVDNVDEILEVINA